MTNKKRTTISVDGDLLNIFYRAALNGYLEQGKLPKGAISEHFEEALIIWLSTPKDERKQMVEKWRNGEHGNQIDSETFRRVSGNSVSDS